MIRTLLDRDIRESERPLWESDVPIPHQGTGQQAERGKGHRDDAERPLLMVRVQREGGDCDRRDRAICKGGALEVRGRAIEGDGGVYSRFIHRAVVVVD